MRTALALLLLGACGKTAAPPSAPPPTAKAAPENRVEPNRSAQLVAAAEQALQRDSPNDYDRPIADKPHDRSQTAKLFVDACNAGDHPSCWKALTIAEPDDRAAIAKLVESNCTNGDTMSCRALPAQPLDAYPKAPGAAGRSEACDDHESTSCDRKALRAECTAGFPRSCITLMLMSPPEDDRDPLLAKAFALSRGGCNAWILSECDRIAGHDGDPSKELALQRGCELDRSCAGYSDLLASKDPVKARDVLERTCQYTGNDGPCNDLAIAYLDGKLPEPVKGRGQALLDWSCARAAKTLPKSMVLTERIPECKRASRR